MSDNRVIIAAAGAGKTTYLIEQALTENENNNVLITTYTEANEREIKNKVQQKNKLLPKNITIQTWFSFLLKHGVKPFQGYMIDFDIKGMILVNGQSAKYTKETDIKKHYFNKDNYIYSDKIAKFLVKCNENSNGKVIDRISRIYSSIYIDEVQDLSGYDLEILQLLFSTNIEILLVCDPRQATYSTANLTKNKQYSRFKIIDFFKLIKNIHIDELLLSTNHRCIQEICEFSNQVFPKLAKATSSASAINEHTGIFIVNKKDVPSYIKYCNPMQLRHDKRTNVKNYCPVMNYGNSKGLTFDHVLIYPTNPIIDWLKNKDTELNTVSRSKLYVAITRARYSVAFIYDKEIEGLKKFIPP